MSRTLTASASAEAAKTSGAAPRLILRIDWGGSIGTEFYGEETLTSPVEASARLLNAGEVGLALSEHGVHAVGDVRIELADFDGAISAHCDDVPLALKRATIYQHFVGNTVDDLLPLLVGHVDDPVDWSEDGRTLSFTVTDILTGHDVTVGHVASLAEDGDFPNMLPGDDGRVLPLVFGRVEDVKAVQCSGGLRGELLHDVKSDAQTIYIEGGEDFEQDTEITILLADEEITGVMHGKTFAITDRTPKYTLHFSGSPVRLAGDEQVFIANDARSLAVVRVRAQKTFTLKSGRTGTREVTQLVDVQPDLYTVDLNDTTSFPALGRSVTTITFATALTELGDDWASDEIFVTLDGYSRDGLTAVTNPAETIRYLLQDFGEVKVTQLDDASFTAAADSLENHSFGFALTDQRDLKALVSDLAMQAQCQILTVAGKVYLFFVSDVPGTAQLELATANVEEESLKRSWVPVEDIRSELTVTYAPDKSGLKQGGETKFTLRDATAEAQWGRRTDNLDLWAYRDADTARSIAQHYLNHRARAWQKTTAVTFLMGLDLLPLDWVGLGGLPYWSTGQRGRIEAVRLQPGAVGRADRIELDLFVPLAAGCASTCEVACEVGGCEGAAEHGAVTCATACETGCQEACQLVCVTTCQASCQATCQTSCETTQEVPEPEYEFALTVPANIERGEDFSLTIQSRVKDPAGDDTAYTPDGNVSITLLDALADTITPSITSATGWSGGAKTVTCMVTGNTGPHESTLRVEDTLTGRVGEATVMIAAAGDMGFKLTAPAGLTRGQAFDLTLQSIYLGDGADDTAYSPDVGVYLDAHAMAGPVQLASVTMTPTTVDETGWSSGAKTVSCTVSGGSGASTIRLRAADATDGRTGYVDVPVSAAEYDFKVTAPANVQRGTAFNLTIQSILAEDGSDDVSYTPAGNVAISENAEDDAVDPTSTDNTGWSSGAKTVSVTLDGGTEAGMVRLTVTDAASGRTGYTDVMLADAGDVGFALSATGVVRYKGFSLDIQSIALDTGANDTGYTPAGDVTIADGQSVLSPDSTDNTGWTDGAKRVSSAVTSASTGTASIVVAVDADSGRIGKALLKGADEATPSGWDNSGPVIDVAEPEYAFLLTTASSSVTRGTAFNLSLQSILVEGSVWDTSYTPASTVELFADDPDMTVDPASTDASGWTDGAKTVSVTLTGGTEATVRIYAHDLASGRIGYVELAVSTAYGFAVSGPSGAVLPDTDFTLGIQSIVLPGGEDDESYVPEGDVILLDDSDDYNIAPSAVNDIGWGDGLKELTARFSGGTAAATVRVTATDPATGRTGYADVIVGITRNLIVYAPSLITRGTPFDLTIQAYNILSGEYDTTYTPAGDVTIGLSAQSDSADGILPVYTANTGWEDGQKVVSCTITGGTGADTITIRVYDPDTLAEGTADVTVATSTVTAEQADPYYYYAGETCGGDYPDYDPDDWDGESASLWSAMQADVEDSFDADTSLSAPVTGNVVAYRQLREYYEYLAGLSEIRGGVTQFSITEANRADAVAAYLRLKPQLFMMYSGTGLVTSTIWSPLAGYFNLHAKFSETPDLFASGAALRAMTPDVTVGFNTLRLYKEAVGGTVSSATPVRVPIPLSVISGMSGSTLYAWLWIEQTQSIAYGGYYRSLSGALIRAAENKMYVYDLGIELLK